MQRNGSQHFDPRHKKKDTIRDNYLKHCGLKVLRFNNLDVLKNINEVMEVIYRTLKKN